MTTEIRKFGEDSGIVLDAELLERAGLKPGDSVEAALAPDGRIVIGASGTPKPTSDQVDSTIQSVMEDYSETMRALA